ncbi:fumarylacetoacetate hydrolase family protein [Uliginosibacterium sp. 31-12]|uniref:fumarylacetoacetate hydrolase family protein n=1 Tax=Uliginosibacterium sp. 31-12 TaxID=3062781 RepID=UPI0026E3D7DF|nr:fumarylacetoacetate hydrolase family protein [Uliginosibacterium sp. 31-12]MDO6388394.1 fumarylacetoacetate hydrolase family protein [Uliginosibacterium sp. 31-12]
MTQIQTLAERLIAARQRKQPLAPGDFATLQVLTRSEAYAVQAAVWQAQKASVRPQAWKIGGSSDQPTPVRAAMPEILFTGASTPQARFRCFGIETEIAVRFGKALPPRATPYAYDEVLDAIDTAHVAIEIVDTALADYAAAGPIACLGDSMLHGSFVLGDSIQNWRRLDWSTLSAHSFIDGQLVAERTGGHPHIDPFTLLPWWASSGALDWGGVQAGDIVTTGTWNGMHFAPAPHSFDSHFTDAKGETLGRASIAFSL